MATRPDETAIPLRGKYTQLVPPTDGFLEEMYGLAAVNEIPWPWSGPETPQGFRDSLWDTALVVFAIQVVRTGEYVGLLKADNASYFHGFAYVTMMLRPEYRMRAWPLEAAVLFGNYVFKKFNLVNLYAETPESHMRQFASGAGKVFEVEGRLRGRVVMNGRREDLYILAFKRELAEEQGTDAVVRAVGDRNGQ